MHKFGNVRRVGVVAVVAVLAVAGISGSGPAASAAVRRNLYQVVGDFRPGNGAYCAFTQRDFPGVSAVIRTPARSGPSQEGDVVTCADFPSDPVTIVADQPGTVPTIVSVDTTQVYGTTNINGYGVATLHTCATVVTGTPAPTVEYAWIRGKRNRTNGEIVFTDDIVGEGQTFTANPLEVPEGTGSIETSYGCVVTATNSVGRAVSGPTNRNDPNSRPFVRAVVVGTAAVGQQFPVAPVFTTKIRSLIHLSFRF
jgi:hypothetical protein